MGGASLFYEEEAQTGLAMKNIHHYMMANLDLLSKKLIFFTVNEGDQHWSGWAAVNPWVQIARVLYEHAKAEGEESTFKDYADYSSFANGLIACDGLFTKGERHARCWIWSPNLASAYHDMDILRKVSFFYI